MKEHKNDQKTTKDREDGKNRHLHCNFTHSCERSKKHLQGEDSISSFGSPKQNAYSLCDKPLKKEKKRKESHTQKVEFENSYILWYTFQKSSTGVCISNGVAQCMNAVNKK